jgi:hypothetical protein
MSEGRILTATEFGEALHDFKHTAFRLELQDSYLEPEEANLFAAFLQGDPPPATTVPELDEWYRRTVDHVHNGARVGRVRVQHDPPTDYQRFERWLDRWNLKAGETMRYLTRQRAHEIGLLPNAGSSDWWLHDSKRLLVMHFDEDGHRIKNELITDPALVNLARGWWDLAVHHSVRATPRGAAA